MTTVVDASRRADARRNVERILTAAEVCLAQDPDASMGDIAREAGLGRVTLYGHFSSRQELVTAVVVRVLAATDAALAEVDLSGDAAAALARLIEASWRATARSGRLLVAADKALPPAQVRDLHGDGLEQRVRAFFSYAQGCGAFRRDLSTDWLVALLHAAVHAAAAEVEAGRLDVAQAPHVIVTTMLAVLQPAAPDRL